MSETLTSLEIEDVLSSIRRLVSEDLRPTFRSPIPSRFSPSDDGGHVSGKLMLTPSLRVVPEAGLGWADDPEGELQPAFVKSAAIRVSPKGAAASIVGAVRVANGSVEGLEPMVETEVAAFHRPETILAPTSKPADEDLIWSSPGVHDEEFEDEAPLAKTEGRLTPGHWTAESLPNVGWMQEEAAAEWAGAETASFVAHPRTASPADQPLAQARADSAKTDEREEMRKPVVIRRPAEMERDLAKPQPVHEMHRPDCEEAQNAPGLFDGDEEIMGGEALREMVREIIREELSGALGERITRNVRKLVRMEVNRALTARSFE